MKDLGSSYHSQLVEEKGVEDMKSLAHSLRRFQFNLVNIIVDNDIAQILLVS